MDGIASPEIVEVTTETGLEALRPEWEALWRSTPSATPFQSPAWLISWRRAFASGDLLTLIVRVEGRLAGLVPLYILAEHGRRKVLPLGIGITDRLDPLLEPRHAAPIMAHLARRRCRIDLEDFAPGSPLLAVPAPPGWGDASHACVPRPALTLPDDPAALRRTVPRLAKLAYYRRRAERLGAVRLELATGEDVDEAVAALFDLHALRWIGRGEPGVLADLAVRRFHRQAAPELLAAGLLRCHVLRIGGRIAAVLYGLADAACFHAYLAGHDPGLQHPGLGAMMIGHAIEQAQAEGLRTFDFLRGREPYKYGWGARDLPAAGRRLTPPA